MLSGDSTISQQKQLGRHTSSKSTTCLYFNTSIIYRQQLNEIHFTRKCIQIREICLELQAKYSGIQVQFFQQLLRALWTVETVTTKIFSSQENAIVMLFDCCTNRIVLLFRASSVGPSSSTAAFFRKACLARISPDDSVEEEEKVRKICHLSVLTVIL